MSTNLQTFLEIAKDSQAKSKELLEAARKPMPGQEGRYVTTLDPDQKSFKYALIAIAFSGVYLDALLYIEGLRRFENCSEKFLKDFDRMTYEKKLEMMSITDQELLAACKRFRDSRNDLIHEKALFFEESGKLVHGSVGPPSSAQEDANDAIVLIDRVKKALELQEAETASKSKRK